MATNKTDKVLNVPTLRFPGFTEEWQEVQFCDVVNLYRGSSPRPIIEFITHSDEGVNWVKIGDMPTTGRLVTSTSERITLEGSKKSRKVSPGDLILSNSMTFGQPYVMAIEGYIHDGWFVLRDYEEKMDRDFLCNLLISPIIQKQYYRLAAGGVVQNISSDLVNQVRFSLPSIAEQLQISHLLNILDERIALQSKLIDHLKSLMDGIVVKHWGGVEKKKYSLTELGEAFSVMNLSKEDLTEDGKRCIIYGELFTTYDAIIDNVVSHTDKVDRLTLSEDNDLLFPASTTVDAYSLIAPSAITERGIVLGGDMFGIHISQEHSAEYISLIINAIYRNKLSKYAKGSTIIHLHYGDIKNVEVELPDLKTQLYLVGVVKRLRTKFSIETDYLVKLNKAKQSLLSALFI